MNSLHADYWLREVRNRDRERALRAEAELFEDAERHAKGLPPIDRTQEAPAALPPPRIGRPPDKTPKRLRSAGRFAEQAGPQVTDPIRHPNSLVCQLAQLWREGKL